VHTCICVYELSGNWIYCLAVLILWPMTLIYLDYDMMSIEDFIDCRRDMNTPVFWHQWHSCKTWDVTMPILFDFLILAMSVTERCGTVTDSIVSSSLVPF